MKMQLTRFARVWLQRAMFILIAMVGAAMPVPASEDPFVGLEATFERLPEHEALISDILGLTSLKSDVRVYLDTHNPAFCGRADAALRVIVLSDWCSERLKVDGNYNWFVVEKLASELGHILNGDGVRDNPWQVRPQGQIENANEFAGWAMRELGATLDEARASLVAAPSPGTFPVPAEPGQLASVERGWRHRSAQAD